MPSRTEGVKEVHRCKQCQHVWQSRVKKPVKCPGCDSRLWNQRPMGRLTCGACGYDWQPRVRRPVRCPRCLVWLEYPDAR